MIGIRQRGSTTTTRSDALGAAAEQLTARLRGALLRPGDSGYDDARALFNGMIDRRPALVARCTGTADGRLLRADHTSHPDLYWALRGGGGNFGIVTQFEFALHALGPDVAFAQLYHPWEDAERVLRHYRDFMGSAPNEIGCGCLVLNVPPVDPFPASRHGEPCVALLATYAGDPAEGHAALKPLLDFGSPIVADLSTTPFTALQSLFDDGFPDGARYYWKAHYLRELPDTAITAFVERVVPLPGIYSACGFEAMGGAVNSVTPDATAFPHRDAAFNIGIFGGWTTADEDAAGIAWARELHAALTPYATGGVYVNYLQGDDDDAAETAYGGNVERLRRVKQAYDPHGLFDAHEGIAR